MRKVRGGVKINKNLKILLPTAAVVVILDQVSKVLVGTVMTPGRAIEVIPGLFNIIYVKNPGAAFGIFRHGGIIRTFFLLAVTAAALVIIGFLLRQSRDRVMSFALSLVAGGAVGNLIDRVRFGSVVDFLDFFIGRHHWPAFNVADSAITVGVIIALYSYYLRPGKEA
jgi:signal peptidase II